MIKFVLQREDQMYYSGLGWTSNALDARKFNTRAEAEQRRLLYPEWAVVEIDVGYQFESLLERAAERN